MAGAIGNWFNEHIYAPVVAAFGGSSSSPSLPSIPQNLSELLVTNYGEPNTWFKGVGTNIQNQLTSWGLGIQDWVSGIGRNTADYFSVLWIGWKEKVKLWFKNLPKKTSSAVGNTVGNPMVASTLILSPFVVAGIIKLLDVIGLRKSLRSR